MSGHHGARLRTLLRRPGRHGEEIPGDEPTTLLQSPAAPGVVAAPDRGADGTPLVHDAIGALDVTFGDDGDTGQNRRDAAAIFGPDDHGIATSETLAAIRAEAERAVIQARAERRARLQEAAPDLLDDMTLIDVPPGVLRPERRADAAQGEADGGEHQEAAPAARPYVPANIARTAGEDPAGPPSAFLRAIMPGHASNPQEPLAGLPFFAGVASTDDGTRVAGLCLGTDDDGWLVIDALSAGWLDALIASAGRTKDALVYGGFRSIDALPGVPGDPQARAADALNHVPAAMAGEDVTA
jgi:hypothetical protein